MLSLEGLASLNGMRLGHCCRYHTKLGPLQAGVKSRLKWADGAAVKKELEAQVADFLGPKTEADLKPPDKKAQKKKVTYSCPADHWLDSYTHRRSAYICSVIVMYCIALCTLKRLAVSAVYASTGICMHPTALKRL